MLPPAASLPFHSVCVHLPSLRVCVVVVAIVLSEKQAFWSRDLCRCRQRVPEEEEGNPCEGAESGPSTGTNNQYLRACTYGALAEVSLLVLHGWCRSRWLQRVEDGCSAVHDAPVKGRSPLPFFPSPCSALGTCLTLSHDDRRGCFATLYSSLHISAQAGVGVEISEVSGTSQLPYGAQRASGPGDCEVLICIGTLKEASEVIKNALAITVFGGLQEVSLGTSVPIIPGIIDEANPDVQLLGSQFANAALKMAQLTGDIAVSSEPFEPMVTSAGGGFVGESSSSSVAQPAAHPQDIQALLDGFRESLKQRGARGIFGLSRKFKIIDDNGSGDLQFAEFTKAISEHAMDWAESEMKRVFDYFDAGAGMRLSENDLAPLLPTHDDESTLTL
jgi:6,7-dimethyl-8-ribityllumazine synthase